MVCGEAGYWSVTVTDLAPGARYLYRMDHDRERPDPASHFQPEGVHGPSEIVDHAAFHWEDAGWKGLPLQSMVLYELHVGTFTTEGTFDAVIPRLSDLKDLGVNAIELMPVSQFPGTRNWGYDGAYPFAVQTSYGGPDGLKRLVKACHARGLAVVLDVVYNHLGPEGNYLGDFGPYFTDKYRTPWGQAVNFDDAYSDEVRGYFTANSLHWIRQYHFDCLRVDAIHGIFDMGARHVLRELGEAVHLESGALGRSVYVIPESDLNDVRVINPVELGGHGLDAQWNDDFHHCVHTLLTGEGRGYYEDFGKTEQFVKAITEGFVYSGEHSVFRKRRHGSSSRGRPAHQFVVFCQNHDQVGNRMLGERISRLATFEALKLAAGAVILSPGIPLLFMGEEYGEDAPFLYFVSHGDKDLIEAVRKGRREEFRAFSWEGEPSEPQAEETFQRSKLDWGKRAKDRHAVLLGFYRTLLKLRRETPALAELDRTRLEASVVPDTKIVAMRRWDAAGTSHVYCLLNFEKSEVSITLSLPEGRWKKVLDSSDKSWAGPGASLPERGKNKDHGSIRAQSVVLFVKDE
jgi:maltooligosyltrehalose trehalohydrolase